ncbi:MAG: thiolase domain-containing protein [Candidatus Eisenbacteria bacterium]|nr:thiolase domain-containing protein [Candidatus Latescibacterota bacterium]MBD3302417.1 thiolase domain-containing protein [Candidatus Eisenbacteria bacterium]
MREVAVIGAGMNRWGELWEKSHREIWTEAALEAIDDAGVDHVEAMYVGCMSGGLFMGQEHLGALLADQLGMGPIPGTRVESACASGGLAFRQAYLAVASGAHDIVLATGLEKMTDVDGGMATYALSTAADQEYECYQGITFPGLYAMMARAHMERYGTTRRQLAEVAVKNHLHGSMNALAQFPMKVTAEQVEGSVMVADPIRILDCSPITDGAAAAVLVPLETAKKMRVDPLIRVAASAHATDRIALHERDDLCWLASTAKAAESAYQQAGVGPTDLSFCEVHDCFTIAEVMVIEALGLVDRGRGGSAAEGGFTALDGRVPVNPSGGLKSKGHPVGATGLAQIREVVHQLRRSCGDRQVKDARLGLTQNMGGTGASTVVHVFERM